MNNLIINCSSDRLQLWFGGEYHELPNRGLEIERPGQFIDWMRQYPISDVYVINGPGSFTTLRVVCLTINLYMSTHPGQVILHHTTKTDLYDKLLGGLGVSQIAIYIGQRNNMWLYDLKTKTHTMMPRVDIDLSVPYDDVSEGYAGGRECIILTLDDGQDNIIAQYGGQESSAPLSHVMTQVDILHPHYLMEPNISK